MRSRGVRVKGQSSPEDIARGVFVCVRRMPTQETTKFRLSDAILGGCVPTGFATVRGVPGVYLNPGAPGVLRFGAQNRDELAPASITDTSV
jgi:hypothetical protein